MTHDVECPYCENIFKWSLRDDDEQAECPCGKSCDIQIKLESYFSCKANSQQCEYRIYRRGDMILAECTKCSHVRFATGKEKQDFLKKGE